MCEFKDEINEDPNPFSTVPPPSGPSGPTEPSGSPDSIIVSSAPPTRQSDKVAPRPTLGNPRKHKRATVAEETEEFENIPSAKRIQTDQSHVPTPAETPFDNSAPVEKPLSEHESSPSLESWSPEPQPSLPPPIIPDPLPQRSSEGREPVPDKSTPSQGNPNQDFPSPPSRPSGHVSSGVADLRQNGRDLLRTLDQSHENNRDQLIQLVLSSLRDEQSCSAEDLCLHRSKPKRVPYVTHERYWIKINWPQVTVGERAGQPPQFYHLSC
ncbi:hypothetical protein FCIRC_6871 [Fusarium circinatum]|uniref:Uncharacterized protein n=1 Tax=Fusarium circinatum TaxID=48490 RepID=A0A8H5X0H5_FUSCI|nr:hypothetical protein FCIRC_6871 [Fusarium circinatum]